MGQQPSKDDNDVPSTANSSPGTPRKNKPGSEAFITSADTNKNESFLKLHKSDREAKWILDQKDVLDALQLQADEMMKEEGLFDDIYDGDTAKDFERKESLRRSAAESVFAGGFSDYAASEVTDTTLAMGNLSRPTPPRRDMEQERLYSMYEDESDKDEIISKPIHQRTSPNRNRTRVQQNIPIAEKKVGTFELYSKLLTACSQPKQDWQIRQEELVSALHLKMKAHLGFYYLERFLPMFPKASKGTEWTNSRDSSNVSTPVEFETSRNSTSVYYSITSGTFLDLAFTGSLGLVPRPDRSPRRAAVSPRRNQKSPDHYIVLINRRSGVPICVCAQKAQSSAPVVRIYATKRRVFGQRPAATTEQLGLGWGGNLPLYTWAEIVTDSMFPDPLQFSMYMASGSDGRFAAHPTFMANFEDEGESVIKIKGRTDMERKITGCALISLEVVEESNGENMTFFQMDIASGIDPSLVLCFTAVIDEIIEKSMRLQCQSTVQRRQQMQRIVGRR